MKQICLDACIAIYLVEQVPNFFDVVAERVVNLGNFEINTSLLLELECSVLPKRKTDLLLLKEYENWFDQTLTIDLNRDVFAQAASLRAEFGSLKTPEALHIAAAQIHNCDEFWTNDDRLSKVAPDLVINLFDTDKNA